MINLHIVTEDLRWACAYAYAAIEAKKPLYNDENKHFQFSFEPTTPAIKLLSEHFAKPGTATTIIEPPSGDMVDTLEKFHAFMVETEHERIHGVRQKVPIQPLDAARLAGSDLMYNHSVFVKVGGYYFPEIPKAQTSLQGIAMEGYVDKTKAFLEGLGIKNPEVACLADLSELEVIENFSGGLTAYCTTPTDRLLAPLRSYYKGFDQIKNSTAVLTVMPDNFDTDTLRETISWAAHMPTYPTETEAEFRQRGEKWLIRKQHNFDHHSYFRSLHEA